jgi:hypothetical protein
MAGRSPLRMGFDRVERMIGSRLESGVETEAFAEGLVLLTRLVSGSRSVCEGASASMLHIWNLPARSDVVRLGEQLSHLDRRLRVLTREVEDLRRSLDGRESSSGSTSRE